MIKAVGARALTGERGRWLRRNWLAGILLAGGLVLRVLAQIAYHPALLYVDTLKYLYGAWPEADPPGYKVILKPILFAGDLGTVALVQHLLGLAIAVAIYMVLVRRGVPRWLGAIAIAPVLLDAYQIQIEQTIMPDVWFEAFVVAGLVLLAWQPEPSVRIAVVCGLLLGASATIRQVGEILVLPALLYLAAATTARRRAMGAAVALVGAFAVPILLFSGISYARYGHFQLSNNGRIAPRIAYAADCATLVLPADETPICPNARQRGYGIDWLDHSKNSPLNHFPVPAGRTRNGLVAGFDSAVESQQPLRVAGSVLADSLHLFGVTKSGLPGVTPISRWQFQTSYPTYRPEIDIGRGGRIVLGIKVNPARPFSFQPLNPAYGGPAQVDRPIASFLRAYQLGGGYTPGPLLAVFAIAGLAGVAAAVGGRRLARRRGGADTERDVSGLAMASTLFFTSAVAVLVASDMFQFSWRYQLPALITLPPAGALGAWATWRMLARRPSSESAASINVECPVLVDGGLDA